MTLRLTSVLAVVVLTLTLAAAAAGTASAATVRKVEGRVVSVDRTERSFRLSDSQRGTFTVFVTGSSRFERVSFASLRAGKGIEATIRRSAGRWVAVKVQPRSATASHTSGTDDNGGRRGRGSDDS
ncbi:MAG: hypothetical protein QOD44_2936 [Solirubrobacteraceae bacterium]|jgi:hypothetical protein|nr:hypothetical protein [Solirubrobacteraceae bacterium]MEA2318747.1 hypothetical protein [Solirubrobacteraceae bacterium]